MKEIKEDKVLKTPKQRSRILSAIFPTEEDLPRLSLSLSGAASIRSAVSQRSNTSLKKSTYVKTKRKTKKSPRKIENVEVNESSRKGSRKFSTVQEVAKREINRRKFKIIARMVKSNALWAKDIHDRNINNAFVVNASEGGESLVFDKTNFKASHRLYRGLNNKTRLVLAKLPEYRTPEDLEILHDVIDKLKCFTKYTRNVRRKLAEILNYEIYDQGRVLIKQGHIGHSFYFIISGSVDVYVTEKDAKKGTERHSKVATLDEGASFGEIGLLHNIRRTATIICKEDHSEFLRIDQLEFDAILREDHERAVGDRLAILKSLDHFKKWPLDKLESFNQHCQLKEFPPNTVIFGNTTKLGEKFQFIVNGNCAIVRDIEVVRITHKKGFDTFRLPSESDLAVRTYESKDYIRNTERRFWKIGALGSGLFFGIGENMLDTYLLSETPVDILYVPRVQFMRLGKDFVTLDDMRKDLNLALPSNTVIFSMYKADCEWERYKRQVVKEVVQRRHRGRNPSTRWEDVPGALKMAPLHFAELERAYGKMIPV